MATAGETNCNIVVECTNLFYESEYIYVKKDLELELFIWRK